MVLKFQRKIKKKIVMSDEIIQTRFRPIETLNYGSKINNIFLIRFNHLIKFQRRLGYHIILENSKSKTIFL